MASRRPDLGSKTAVRFIASCLGAAAGVLYSRWGILAAAAVVAAILVYPWSSAEPRSYEGFDSGLMFVDPQAGQEPGQIRQSEETLEIEARPGSAPAAHLVASAAGFATDFTVRVDDAARANEWRSVEAMVTAPGDSAFLSILVGAVGGTAIVDDITVVPAGSSRLEGVHEDFEDTLHEEWSFNSGAVVTDTGQGSALQINAPTDQERGAWSAPLDIGDELAGQTVQVTARIRAETANVRFKVAVEWLNEEREHLAYAPTWPDWETYNQSAVPLRVSLWHPSHGRAVNLVFGAGDNNDAIEAFSSSPDGSSPPVTLAPFAAGTPYQVHVGWNPGENGRVGVTPPDGETRTYEGSAEPELTFSESPLANLSFYASAPKGMDSSATVESFRLTIPAQTRLFAYADDWRLEAATLVVVAWVGGYVLINWRTAGRHAKIVAGGIIGVARGNSKRKVGLALLAGCALLAIYAAVGTADGHSFDRLSQESWMHVIDRYGVDDLYARSSAIGDNRVRGGGASWNSAEMAYPPGIAYFYLAEEAITDLVVPDSDPLESRTAHVVWKLGFGVFVLVTAAATAFAIRRVLGSSMRLAVVGGLFMAISPALVFDAVIWGQSDSLLVSLLLLGTILVMTDKPRLGWAAFGFSLLIKQTAFFTGPIFLAVTLSRYGWRRSIEDISFATVLVFSLMSPLILMGYSPATLYMPTIGKLFDFTSTTTAFATHVSADTFPVWSLITGLDGNTGLDRIHASDVSTIPLLGISYMRAGQLATLLMVGFASFVGWKYARSNTQSGLVFLVVGLAFLAYVTFGTRTSGRYLTLALPFLVVGIAAAGSYRWWLMLAGLTFVSVLSQYGLFMHIASRGEWSPFHILGSPESGIGRAVYWMYTSDVLITLYATLLFLATAAISWHVASVVISTRAPRSPRTVPDGQPVVLT